MDVLRQQFSKDTLRVFTKELIRRNGFNFYRNNEDKMIVITFIITTTTTTTISPHFGSEVWT